MIFKVYKSCAWVEIREINTRYVCQILMKLNFFSEYIFDK
jgi:hypothetical protein